MVAVRTNVKCAVANRDSYADIISCSAGSVSVNGPVRLDLKR
jgi:hypothetical protein